MYSGGRHGCVNVRDGIKTSLTGDASIVAAAKRVGAAYKAGGGRSGSVPRQAEMHATTFCPCPEGDSPSAKRQYDALLAGCVPVVISDDAIFAFDEHVGGPLDSSTFALRVSEQDTIDGKLLDALDAVPDAKLRALKAAGADAARWYRYYAPGSYSTDPLPQRVYPNGGALAVLVSDLENRTREGPAARWNDCARELNEPHFDLTKQYCGAPNREKEIYKLAQAAKSHKSDVRESAIRGIRDWKSGHILR